jgi:hypothetical protein
VTTPKPLKVGDRVVNRDGITLVVRAIYTAKRGGVAEVALRSLDGAIDFLSDSRRVEKWERA